MGSKLTIKFISIILVTFLLGVTLGINQKNHSIDDLSNHLLDQLNKNIIETTTNYIKPALHLAQSSAKQVKEGAINPYSHKQLEQYFRAAIAPYPQINSLNFGDPSGTFIMVKRMSDSSLLTKTINRNAELPFARFKQRNMFDEVISDTTSYDIQYDPRTRPWYIGGKENGDAYWTDIYIFFTSQNPGLTAAYPSFSPKGYFTGVFGVDIELDLITSTLSKLKPGENSKILIINDKNKVISYPGMNNIIRDNENQIQPFHITDLEDPLVEKVLKKHETEKEEKFSLIHKQTNYLVSFKKFPRDIGKKWTIILIVPKNELTN